jgi:hypothetical protein
MSLIEIVLADDADQLQSQRTFVGVRCSGTISQLSLVDVETEVQ